MKKFLNKLINPDIVIGIIAGILNLAIIAFSIVCIFVVEIPDLITYISFPFATIALVYLIYLIILLFFKINKNFRNLAKEHKITRNFIENFEFRSIIFTILSVLISLFYIISQIVAAAATNFMWYLALAIYSSILMILRIGVIFKHFKHKTYVEEKEDIACVRSYRNCGMYLFALNLALTVAIVLMITTNQGFEYPGLLIYFVAVHTFYKLVMSIINIVRAKKEESFAALTTKNLNFTSALVSILALQTALFHTFSKNLVATIPNAITGVCVVAGIIVLAIIMIVNGQRELKKLKQQLNKKN